MITAILVALIGALAMVLAAAVPVLISSRRTRAAAEDAKASSDAHGPTLDKVAASVNRLEGKVDVIASLLHVHGGKSAEVVRLWDASDHAAGRNGQV